MEKIKVKLNKEQEAAVNHGDGPILIVAGAGTGKTAVITNRIASLVEKGLAKSDEILALTFTEKAAGEMEERADRLLPYGYFDLWVMTFHSFGEKILRESGLEIGLSSDFKLLNEFEQYSLFKKNLDRFDLDYYRPMGNPTKFIRSLLQHFSRCKDEDISPLDYLKYAEELKQNLDKSLSGEELTAAELDVKKINEIADAYHVYQNLLLENSALDFGDVINYCLKLFRDRPNILYHYQKKFKYVLIDEFQDTNLAQYELIKMLSAPQDNITVCADDDQAIYRFRGAAMTNVLQFKKDYPEAKEVFLKENYRSAQNILDLSYNFIKLNDPNRLEFQLKKAGENLSKKLNSNLDKKGQIEVLGAADSADEMNLIVKKIAAIKTADKEASWGDFAVLSRSNDSAKEICAHFDEAGFPYVLCSSRGLYGKSVIMDSICYLRALSDYYDNPSLFRVLNMPLWGFDFEDLINFNYLAGKKAWSIYQVLNNAAALGVGEEKIKKINFFLGIFKKQAAAAKEKSASEIFLSFINDSGYLKYILRQGEKKYVEETNLLNHFMKRIKEFEKDSQEKTVRAFLAELEIEMESGEEGDLPADVDAGPDTIKVMTVHASKGLEFKYVFITNLVDKRFPTTERKEAIEIPPALVKEVLPEGDHHLEEERRLFYVAMTRAKEGLYLTWANDCGGKRAKRASRFLVEAGLVEDLTLENIKDDEKSKTTPQPLLEKEGGKEFTPPFQGGARGGSHESATPPFQGGARGGSHESATPPFQGGARGGLSEVKKFHPEIPKTFSYTQLAAFESCPYQYRFAHILKVPTAGKPSFSFGKTMHSAMQKIFQAIAESGNKKQTSLFSCHSDSESSGEESVPIPRAKKDSDSKSQVRGSLIETDPSASLQDDKITLAECLKLYEDSWVDDWYPSEKLKEEYRQKGRQIIKDFYEKYNGRWPEVLLMEKGFNMKVAVDGENFTIRGQIDRIDNLGDKIKIVDYKTGSVKDKLEFKDKAQLLIYQLAVKELFRQGVGSLAFYYLEENKEMEFLGSEKDLEKIQEKIADNIRAIKKGEFPATPSPLCKFCDFNGICEFKK